jgi:hypothetical protein
MASALECLAGFGGTFRDIVNAVNLREGSPHALHDLAGDDSWSILCVSMDIIGDTCGALGNFMRFGLDGPTKYDDPGERYLRLYGLLSATYLQQDAALKVHELMKCSDHEPTRNSVYALDVRKLRNKVAAHSVDYREGKSGPVKGYAPVHIELRGFNCTINSLRMENSETTNLDAAVTKHCEVLTDILDRACEKALSRLDSSQEDKRRELTERVGDLKYMRRGGVIVRLPGNRTLQIGPPDAD